MMRVFISVKIKSISEEIRVIWNYKKWSNNFIHDGNLKQNIIDNFLVFYAVGPMGCQTNGQTPPHSAPHVLGITELVLFFCGGTTAQCCRPHSWTACVSPD